MKKLLLGFALAVAVLVVVGQVVVNAVMYWATLDTAQTISFAAALGKPLCSSESTGAEFARDVPLHLRSAFAAAEEPGFLDRPAWKPVSALWDLALGRSPRLPVLTNGIVRCQLAHLREWSGVMPCWPG